MDAVPFNFELGWADLPLRASFDPETKKRRIEGISSSTIRDGHGDEITMKALEKMAKQAVGLTVFMNHGYDVPKHVFGTVTRSRVMRSADVDKKTNQPIWDLMCGIEVEDENPDAVSTWNMINKGTKLGISVGAMVPDGGVTKSQTGGRYTIDDVDLFELSIVGVPANPRCWAQVATKSLKEAEGKGIFIVKEVEGLQHKDDEERQLEKKDVEDGTDSDGRSDGIVAGPDIMDAGDGPDPDAKPAEAEATVEDGQKDKDSIENADADDGIITTDDIIPSPAPLSSEAQKTRVTVWDGPKTIEIDTGRSKKTGDDQSAQDDPETAGGLPSDPTTKALTIGATEEGDLVKALRGQLNGMRRQLETAEARADDAYRHAAGVVEKVDGFMKQLGELPMGRRTQFIDVKSKIAKDLSDDLDELTFLDPEVKRILRRTRQAEHTGSPKR